LAVVAIGLMVLNGSVIQLHQARQQAQEEAEVLDVLETAADTLRSLEPTVAFQDASSGAITFEAPSLHGAGGAATQVVIELFTDETANVPELGLPRDLDGDGKISNSTGENLNADGKMQARLVPVRLTLPYRSSDGGNRSVQWYSLLTMDGKGQVP
jgi:hypothetical protein